LIPLLEIGGRKTGRLLLTTEVEVFGGLLVTTSIEVQMPHRHARKNSVCTAFISA
jgi:hypothetical protein